MSCFNTGLSSVLSSRFVSGFSVLAVAGVLAGCSNSGLIAPVGTNPVSTGTTTYNGQYNPGQSVTTTTYPAQATTYVAPQPVQQPIPGRPSASTLDMSVANANDEVLSDSQLNKLISGRTIYSQNLDNPTKTQIGTFTTDGNMSVATGGNTITGQWSVENGRVCYLIGGKRFCSKVQRSAKDYNGAPVYYFRRDSGEPTVVITGFS